MFKFIRGRGHGHLSADRIKDLFAFNKTATHGFPHHPTALAYDPVLGLIALTTKKGEFRVYGRPGVEYSGQLEAETVVREIHFIGDRRGQLVILTECGLIQLWQLSTEDGSHKVELCKSVDYFVRGEGSIRHAITLLVNASLDQVLVGTTGGNIYSIALSPFTVSEDADAVIYQDVVLHSVPAEYKKTSQGSVEVIAERPGHPYVYLIGYNRGLLILWDAKGKSAERVYNSSQQLESASWMSSGDGFISSHNDGSYISWKVSDPISLPVDGSKIPYGPFPCKPIGRILCKTVRNGENLLFFTGGMPRSTYGDKLTVSVIQGDQDSGKHHVLDFTSKVIDFAVIDDPADDEYDNPIALIILLEEEIVLIDVRHPDWLQFKLPYLSSVHSSGITACQYYSDLPDEIFDELLTIGKKQDEGKYSTSDWPITGGSLPQTTSSPSLSEDVEDKQDDVVAAAAADVASASQAKTSDSSDDFKEKQEPAAADAEVAPKVTAAETTVIVTKTTSTATVNKTKDVLVTGHEDGSILFWNASDVNLYHILTISTRKYFMATDSDITPIDVDENPESEDVGSEWPPFRKVGTFDPYSDDTRLAIRRLSLCPMTAAFAAAGTAGQVIYFKLTSVPGEKEIPIHSANLVEETTGFIWKGHDQLHVKNGSIKSEPGFEPEFMIQLSPPAATTALSLNTEWNILSAGTAHGFVVFDLVQNKVILHKSTLNPADLIATAGGDVLISRRKSFKKSLRESFRRLRRGRGTSTRVKKVVASSSEASSPEKTAETPPASSPIRSIAASDDAAADAGGRPVERQIEARQDDGLGSMIRTISYASANITTSGSPVPTIWIGTNAGAVLIYTLSLPEDEEKRSEEAVTMSLAKEIQLKHRAPVIFIQVIDSTGYPLPGAHEVAQGKAKAPSTIGHQRVLIVSEEQFKLFSLPSLKPDRKSKLTAHEGSRARRIAVSQFDPSVKANSDATGSSNSAKAALVEHCLTCCSNQGDVSVYSINDLKRIQNHSVTKREDVHGIASIVLTTRGEGLYLHSPSEFQRFSLSAQRIIAPTGVVRIPDGARPAIVDVVVPEAAAVADAAKEAQEEKPSVDVLSAAVDAIIREETEEEVAAVGSDAEVFLPAGDDQPIAHSTPLPPVTVAQPDVAMTQDSTISSTLVQEATTLLSTTLLESALNGTDEPALEDAAIVEAVIEKATDVVTSTIPDVLNGATSILNGLNGKHNGQKNGHPGLDEDEEDADSESHVNGANGVDISANASILTADITIDSVRDYTNLNESSKSVEKERKSKKSSPAAPASTGAAASEAVGNNSGGTTTTLISHDGSFFDDMIN